MAFLVNLEGIDGSGKGTQASRLVARLRESCSVELLSFPRYAQTLFGQKIGDFLNGRFGNLDAVSPFLAALLYAGDRFESKQLLQDCLNRHEVVVLDRYVPSNIAHQASKCDGDERREVTEWIQRIEWEIYGMPRPDLVLWLDVPPRLAVELIAQKSQRNYTDRAADLQEADWNHLQRTYDVYRQLAADPTWCTIACAAATGLRSPEDIAAEIFARVQSARGS